MWAAQFDGNAAFAGGGFMPSQATQTADPSSSISSSREEKQLLPLTLKQINDALQSSDDKSNFLIDGVDVNSVKLLGMVVSRVERVSEVTFVIDDGTGRIDCNKWVNEAVDAKEVEGIMEGMYIRVHGQLKGFQGKKQLVVFSIRPVIDYNEITNHFVECIYVHFYNTKLRLQGGAITPGHMPNSSNIPFKGYQATPSNQFSGVHYNTDGLEGIQKMVLDCLQQPSCIAGEWGLHRDEIAKQLNQPTAKIMGAIEALEAEGLVYPTIDVDHYKSTING